MTISNTSIPEFPLTGTHVDRRGLGAELPSYNIDLIKLMPWFVHIRHYEMRNLEAGLLYEVCRTFTGEVLSLLSSNTGDNVRFDMKTRDFYRRGQTAFFDIRVTNLRAPLKCE